MRHPMLLGLLSILVACSAGGDDAASGARSNEPLVPTSRDSAGVTLSEHAAGALERAPLLVLDTTGVGEVVGAGETDDLSRVYQGVALSDGGFAFFDPLSSAVWIIDSLGAVTHRYGRSGQGPGEFQRAAGGIARGNGDTLAVVDQALQRATFLHPSTGILASHPFTTRFGGNFYALVGQLRSGGWIMGSAGWIIVGTGAADIGTIPIAPVYRYVPGATAPPDSITFLTGLAAVRSRYRMLGKEDDGVGHPRFASPGNAVGWDGALMQYDNRRWEVDRIDVGGDGHRTRIVVHGAARLRTPAMIESLVVSAKERAANSPTPQGNVMMESAEDAEFNVRNAVVADTLSPFDRVFVAPGGTLWLGDQAEPQQKTVWYTAVDTSGRILARVQLPASRGVLALGDRSALIRHEGEDGVVTLRIHRLVKSGDGERRTGIP
jgi:hypothetical protein